MVVAQFAISITLITSTIIVMQQVNFMQHSNLGLDKEQVITVNDIYTLDPAAKATLKNELLHIPGVSKVASSDAVIADQNWTKMVRVKGSKNNHLIHFLTVDEDFINAMHIKIITGRNFSPAYPSDEK